jgi:hypothetical protein
MDLYKLGIKRFIKPTGTVEVRDFIPVFHQWIQQQSIPGHLLLDVHDYAHVQDGPGILLVAHEGNFNLGSEDGRLGLSYTRKQPIEGGLAALVKIVDAAAGQLNGLTFDEHEMLVFSNDRLLAPNTAEGRSTFEPIVAKLGKPALFSHDPRERLAFLVRQP